MTEFGEGDMCITRDNDTVTADGFPAKLLVTPEALAMQDDVFEACWHLNLANGYAEYHIVGWDNDVRAFQMKRVTASPRDMCSEEGL